MTDGMFAGDHNTSSEWQTLKGKMLAPHELPVLQSTAMGDTRHQTNAMPTTKWDASTIVNTGITGGGGTMAK